VSESPLSFHRAQYEGEPFVLFRCSWCERGLHDTCFRANGARICASCAARAKGFIPFDSTLIFWRSVAWGFAASVGVGLALFLLGSALLRWRMGWTGVVLASIPAGDAIGRVMQWASGGVGGRRYQIAASLLVYSTMAITAFALILGLGQTQFWAIPLLVLAPPAWLFVGRNAEAGLAFTMAFLGIRMVWRRLQAWPLRVTGPESVVATPTGPAQEI